MFIRTRKLALMAAAPIDSEEAKLREIRRLQMLALPYEKPRFEGGEAESDYYEEEFPEEIIEEKDGESNNSDLDFGV